MKMRIVFLLLVAFAALAEAHKGNHKRRAKRELLVRSKRRWVLSTIEVTEEDPGPFPKEISQMFNDKIKGQDHKYEISGMGVTEEPMGVFRINDQNGVVEALKPIDREQYELFHIKFDILDRNTGKKIDRELAFDIEIKDINDNPPKFVNTVINAEVKENMPEGFLPAQLQVSDRDQINTTNSKITVSVVSQMPENPKIGLTQLDDRLAQLTFEGCFDYDKIKKYKIIVMAKDHGLPALSSSATINLNIVDTNSHAPTFIKKEYKGEVQESTTKKDLLRLSVEDKDTPKTPGWRAKYFFIKGNEDNNYEIVTDPETNDGIVNVIKGQNFDRTTLTNLEIGVENEESLFVCNANKGVKSPFRDSINVTVKVVDVNDPPLFEKEKVDVYRREEEPPGKELFTPKVRDIDSDITKMRYVLLDDPANWVAIDKKTGKVTSTKKMDRESPYVDSNNVYQVIIGAIDDGEPPATGTCTVKIHLGDINDNLPLLVNNSFVMCGNKDSKVMLHAKDADLHPYSGPFAFSLGDKDKSLAQQWKLDPAFGEEAGIINLKPIPDGNYSVPLVIQDQQNMKGYETLKLRICYCGEGQVCRARNVSSLKIGYPGIGLLVLGLIVFLLMLLLCKCECSDKLKGVPIVPDEGTQNLIKYNQEGGGSACMTEPRLLTPLYSPDAIDFKQSTYQMSQMPPKTEEMDIFNSQYTHNRDSVRSKEWPTSYSSWNASRMNTFQSGSSRYYRSTSFGIGHDLEGQIQQRVSKIEEDNQEYYPCEYAYEGRGSTCGSLEEVSLGNPEDNLHFLDDIGPRFKPLGAIFHDGL